MGVRLVPLALVAVALARSGSAEPAAANPLGPLTAVVQHLKEGVGAYLAGKPASEAFAPWRCDDESAEKTRGDLKAAKVASAKPFASALEMYFVQDGETKTNMVVDLWLGGQAPSVAGFERGLQIGDPMEDSMALEDFQGVAKPFAEAARALRPMFSGDAWKGLPVTSKADVEALLPEGPVRDEALETVGNVLRDAEAYTKEIARAPEATLRLAVGDLKCTVYDGDGKLVGMLAWRVTISEAGISLKPRRFRPFAGR